MNPHIVAVKHLEPYFKIAKQEAIKSPCVRRKYGAVIAHTYEAGMGYIAAHNQRVAHCCDGICARNLYDLPTDGRHPSVEIGAEVHAETAALIADTSPNAKNKVMVLVGYKGDHELLGANVWPCRVCAMNMRYAGINYFYAKNNDGIITPYNTYDVIEYREQEWVQEQ